MWTRRAKPGKNRWMLLVGFVLVAILVGRLTGGRLSSLDLAALRLWWLAPLGLAIQLLSLEEPWAVPALMASYALLVAFAAVNVRITGIPLILLGLAMNWLVIGLNGGMPVDVSHSEDPAAVTRLAQEGGSKHHVMSDEDSLAFLGDGIWIGGIREVYSPGDLILYAGVAWFIVAGMRGNRNRYPEDQWGAERYRPG